MELTRDKNIRVTQSELAKETGYSRAWISKLKKKGKLIFGEDGKICLGDALQQIEGSKEYTRDPQREYNEKIRKKLKQKKADDIKVDDIYITNEPEIGNVKCSIEQIGIETQRSRLARETYEAKLKMMEYFEKIGELIPLSQISKAQQRIAIAIRSKLLLLPVKVAPICEGRTAVEIEQILKSEINKILEELHHGFN